MYEQSCALFGPWGLLPCYTLLNLLPRNLFFPAWLWQDPLIGQLPQ